MTDISFAHKSLEESCDTEWEPEFNVFNEIRTEVIAIEPVKYFKWLSARNKI